MQHLARKALRLCLTAGVGASMLVVPAINTGTPTAAAAKPTAAVAMGDSFISGEGAGSYDSVVDINGATQGYQDFSAPNDNAYFCHRSTQAQIEVAALPGIDERVNIACSGGIPHDVANPSINRDHGRYVAAQLDQLRAVSQTHDIDLVLIGLGANSVGFGEVAQKCIGKFLTDAFTGWWEPWVNIWSPHATTTGACGAGDFPNATKLAQAEAEVAASTRLILQTLQEIDPDGEHRVVFQDYVNPLPPEFDRKFHDERRRRDTRDKFRSLARERYAAGCPVHRGTLQHAHNMSRSLGGLVGNVHDQMLREFPGADLVYLNVQNAFDGARLCETAASPAGALHAPTRAITSSDGRVQHTLDGNKSDVKKLFENCTKHFQRCQESWHPNAGGHAILGQCLTAAWGAPTSLVDCRRSSNGQILTTAKAPSLDVSVHGRVHESLGRSGDPVFLVMASYSSRVSNAPGLSVTSTEVTARAYPIGRYNLATQRSQSGSYSYQVPCGASSTDLWVNVHVTLSDGSTLDGSSSFYESLGDCGSGDVPIR